MKDPPRIVVIVSLEDVATMGGMCCRNSSSGEGMGGSIDIHTKIPSMPYPGKRQIV